MVQLKTCLRPHKNEYIPHWHGSARVFKGDSESQWGNGKFDPPVAKPPNRSSPKLSWVITSGTSTSARNLVPIGLEVFAPICAKLPMKVTRLLFYFIIFFLGGGRNSLPFSMPSFDAQYVKRRVISRKDMTLGVPKTNGYVLTLSPQTSIFGAFLTRLGKLSAQNAPYHCGFRERTSHSWS